MLEKTEWIIKNEHYRETGSIWVHNTQDEDKNKKNKNKNKKQKTQHRKL